MVLALDYQISNVYGIVMIMISIEQLASSCSRTGKKRSLLPELVKSRRAVHHQTRA